MGAEPADQQNTSVYDCHHERHYTGDIHFSLYEHFVDIARGLMKFADLIVLADIGFYHPYRRDVLLYAVVEVIISFEHLLEIPGRSSHDERHYERKEQNGSKIDPRQSGTDYKGHSHCDDHGSRRPHRHSQDHLIGVLYISHVCCQPCDKTGRRKLVDA